MFCTVCVSNLASKHSQFHCDACLAKMSAGGLVAAAAGKPLPDSFDYKHEYYELLDKTLKMRQRLVEQRDRWLSEGADPTNPYRNSANGRAKTVNRLISDFNFLHSKNRKAIESRYGALPK